MRSLTDRHRIASRPLRHELIGVLALKTCALLLLYALFFASPTPPDTGPHLFGTAAPETRR